MSNPNIIQSFVPELAAVAISSFVFGGEVYEPDKPFPHKERGVDKMNLNGLWLAGLIRFVQPPAIAPTRVSELVQAIRDNSTRTSDDLIKGFDEALDELEQIARGTFVAAPPAPIVYKEDPADEPDPEVLKAQLAAVRATVPKPPKAPKAQPAQ